MSAKDVIVWALEQRTFDRTPVMEKATAILQEFAFNGMAVVERDSAIDAEHLAHQREWSERTFGPGSRLHGVTDHIAKELIEVRDAAPNNLDEWVDVIILAFDGAWRSGAEPQQIIAAVKAKQAKNEARDWPDWRTADPDKAIEHVRP